MMQQILRVDIKTEHDVVFARQRARQIAAALEFDPQDQTRIATACSEICRNAFEYAKGGKVVFSVDTAGTMELHIEVSDSGAGIADVKKVLAGTSKSKTGLGVGIIGAQRLMDRLEVRTDAKGTSVTMSKRLPKKIEHMRLSVTGITEELARTSPRGTVWELQQQNQEMLRLLDELHTRQSELDRLNQELQETNRGVLALYSELDDKAESFLHASELKSRFLSEISHEFRTPLNSIVSLSRMLLDRSDGDLSSEQERQVGFVQRSAQHLTDLVNDLLDLAKIEAGKVVVRPAQFTVNELFAALRGMFRPLMLEEKSVVLVFDEPFGLPNMNSDEGKLSQILRNLISNALKFTEKGEVHVSAAALADGNVRFTVRDTGIGIKPEDIAIVFQEWGQVESKIQRNLKGSGLGLPLSKRLAAILGGELTVESVFGKGSEFFITLPPVYPGIAGDSVNKKVLIIDDDEVFRYVLRRQLSSGNLDLLEASGGLEGTRMLQEFRPDLVLLDLSMPDSSGFEVLEKMRLDPRTAQVPVVLVTSKSLTEAEQARITSMHCAYVNKKSISQAGAAVALSEHLKSAGIALSA